MVSSAPVTLLLLWLMQVQYVDNQDAWVLIHRAPLSSSTSHLYKCMRLFLPCYRTLHGPWPSTMYHKGQVENGRFSGRYQLWILFRIQPLE